MDNDERNEILWRLDDIKDMLMSTGIGGDKIYGCDEWSVPIKNINTLMDHIRKRLEEPPE